MPVSPETESAARDGRDGSRGAGRGGSIPPLLGPDAPLGQRAARVVLRLVQGLRVHDAGHAAPAMAFHFFLSLIPVLVLAGFVLGHVVRQKGVDAILGPALETAPDAAEQIVRYELERLAGASATPIAPLSIVGFLWLAATGTHGLMDVFERAAGALPRAWWKQRAFAMAWVASALAVLAALAWGMLKVDALVHRETHGAHGAATSSASASTASNGAPTSASTSNASPASAANGASGSKTKRHTPRIVPPFLRDSWERLAALTVLSAASIAALAAFFRFGIVHPPGVRRRSWPGAVVAFASWIVVSWVFGAYSASLGKYALFYGSVAAVAVLLVWFYLTSWALLLGAEINAQLEGLRDPPPKKASRAPRIPANHRR